MFVFDLEGTLSDFTHRLRYYEEKSWPMWNLLFTEDLPREDMGVIFRLAKNSQVEVMILTSKEDCHRPMVVNWLIQNDLIPDHFMMKPTRDQRTSPEFKTDILLEMRKAGHPVSIVFDDRKDVIDALIQNGIPAIWVGQIYEK